MGGGAAGGVGVVSAARAEELAADARKAEGAVRAARLEKKEAEGKVKKLEARGKHLQVRTVFRGVLVDWKRGSGWGWEGGWGGISM